MFRFDWDEDETALGELARDFGRAAAARERDAVAAGAVPADLRRQAEDTGLVDLARSEAHGGPGLGLLAAGHAIAELVAQAPTIGTALLLPEAGAVLGAGPGTAFADGGGGCGGYLKPSGFALIGRRVEGRVPFAALPAAPSGLLVAARGAAGDVLCRVDPARAAFAPCAAMGLEALALAAVEVAGEGDEVGPCGPGERAALFLYFAPFFHGYGRAALDYALHYAAERKAFGRLIGSFQGIAFGLAEVAMEGEAAELLWQEAAWRHGRGEDAFVLAAQALRAAKDAAFLAANTCVGTLGGHGFVDDHPAERWLRDVETLSALTGNRAALAQAGIADDVREEAEGIA